MKEETITQLLQFLLDTLQETKDFTLDQAPVFVQELLMWYFYEHLFFAGFGVLVILFGLAIGWILKKNLSPNDQPIRYTAYLGGWIIGLLFLISNTYDLIKVSVAPKVVLLEMVRNFISGTAGR